VADNTDGPLARAMAWSLAGAQAAYALSSTLLFPLTDMLACFFEVVSAWLQAGAMVCAALLSSRPQDAGLQAASLWLYIASLALMVLNVWITVVVKVLLAIKARAAPRARAADQGPCTPPGGAAPPATAAASRNPASSSPHPPRPPHHRTSAPPSADHQARPGGGGEARRAAARALAEGGGGRRPLNALAQGGAPRGAHQVAAGTPLEAGERLAALMGAPPRRRRPAHA
jgi:hypothetical protein